MYIYIYIYILFRVPKYESNIKKSRDIIKDAIEKTRYNDQKTWPRKFPSCTQTIINLKLIAQKFNNFFTDIEPTLAKEIENFKVYHKK